MAILTALVLALVVTTVGAQVHPARPRRALATVEKYDLATNTWRARSPMPTARNHAAVGVVNGEIYVIGGRIGAALISVASNTDVVEEYDPATRCPRCRYRGMVSPAP